ncbi:MAG: hypothetical protein E3J21_02380 [Anaerolineales bacterium]|nr:MAG: hypothetical protein E3J21_02380 [Anaerolineales bacterium]
MEEELLTKAKEFEKINELSSEKIYTRGDKNAFLYWPEFGLKDLGRLGAWNAYYAENARDNPEKFKELLRKAVDDSLSKSEKIDASWEDIKYFGGDKTVAKKIIFCYYPEEVLPIFKTEHLKHFVSVLKLDFKKEAHDYSRSYDVLSVGQQFELLNKLLLSYKGSIEKFKSWDNVLFMKFLYEHFPPFERE